MLIRAVQHNNYPRRSPRMIPCLPRTAYPRLATIPLSVVLCTLLLDPFLTQLTRQKPQTLASDHLFNHRRREWSQLRLPERTLLLYQTGLHSLPLLLFLAKTKRRLILLFPRALRDPLAQSPRFPPITETIISKRQVHSIFIRPFAQVPNTPTVGQRDPQPYPHPLSDSLRFVIGRPTHPFLSHTYRILFFLLLHSDGGNASFQSRIMTTMKFSMIDARKTAQCPRSFPFVPPNHSLSLVVFLPSYYPAPHPIFVRSHVSPSGVLTTCCAFQIDQDPNMRHLNPVGFQGFTAILMTVRSLIFAALASLPRVLRSENI